MNLNKVRLEMDFFISDMEIIKEAINKEKKANIKNRKIACMLIDGMILNARRKFKNNNNNTNYVF